MSERWDIVTVGGGLGGAAFAKVMAERGARVLVLERTREFRDRVRGEVLVPWGCIEAERVGIYDRLYGRAHDLPLWRTDLYGMEVFERDLPRTTRSARPVITYFHPDMQEVVLDAACSAGAEVRRGAIVSGVEPGMAPMVAYSCGGASETVQARLVVGADGRASMVRKWGGFEARTEPAGRMFAGILIDDFGGPDDALHGRFASSEGSMSWIFPQGGGRVRAYIGSHVDSDIGRLQGAGSIERFIEHSVRLGVPREYFEKATPAGPLAGFDASDNWVDHPYRDGVALIGDAAATSDPTWGQGMSLTLRDVRVLGEALAADDDWDRAGHAYASAHDQGYGHCRRCDGWYTQILLGVGPEADRLRERVLPLLAEDGSRLTDTPLDGPDEIAADEAARRRMFGED